jgi:uncharacterized membrane protein
MDLNPNAFTISEALATDGTEQVGYAENTANQPHAMFWQGTAGSVVDLSATLPAQFTYSEAFSVSGDTVYGWAQDTSGNYHSIEWTVSVPEPAGLFLTALGLAVAVRRRRRRSPECGKVYKNIQKCAIRT